MDRYINPILIQYRQQGVEIRINIMLKKFHLFHHKEPRKKDDTKNRITMCSYVLHTFWKSTNMNHSGDKNIRLTINQGVCGMAIREEAIQSFVLTPENIKEFNLNAKQLKKTKDIKFIMSYPIFEPEINKLKNKNKILGVVNIDSTVPGSEILITKTIHREELAEKIYAISDYCSFLI